MKKLYVFYLFTAFTAFTAAAWAQSMTPFRQLPYGRFAARSASIAWSFSAREATLECSATPERSRVSPLHDDAEGRSAEEAAPAAATLRITFPDSQIDRVIQPLDPRDPLRESLGEPKPETRLFGQLWWEDLWPGVSLIWTDKEARFLLTSAARLAAAKVEFTGGKLRIDSSGELAITTPAGELRFGRPTASQDAGDVRKLLAGRYLLVSPQVVALEVPELDSTLALTVTAFTLVR